MSPPAGSYVNDFPSQTVLADGDLLVVWDNELTLDAPPASIVGRRFSLHHPPGPSMQLARGLGGLFNPLLAPRGEDGFLFTFIRDEVDASSFGCFAVPFGGDGRPLGPEVQYASNVGCGEGLIALADGTYATSWLQERALRPSHAFVSIGCLPASPRWADWSVGHAASILIRSNAASPRIQPPSAATGKAT